MYITLETDYAVRIVDYMIRSDCRVGAQAISDATNVTLRFSLKILSKLVKSGILLSFKGVNGGYELGMQPEDISINDILEAIEGPYVFNRCLNNNHVCDRNANKSICNYHLFFAEISDNITETLKKATMDKLV